MTTALTEVTGREASGCGEAIDALIGFYRAFNARDLDGLAANWEQGDAPSMDNPMGGIRRGWPSIREGYLKLFTGPAVVQVTFHDFTSRAARIGVLFVGRKIGTCVTPRHEDERPIPHYALVQAARRQVAPRKVRGI